MNELVTHHIPLGLQSLKNTVLHSTVQAHWTARRFLAIMGGCWVQRWKPCTFPLSISARNRNTCRPRGWKRCPRQELVFVYVQNLVQVVQFLDQSAIGEEALLKMFTDQPLLKPDASKSRLMRRISSYIIMRLLYYLCRNKFSLSRNRVRHIWILMHSLCFISPKSNFLYVLKAHITVITLVLPIDLFLDLRPCSLLFWFSHLLICCFPFQAR